MLQIGTRLKDAEYEFKIVRIQDPPADSTKPVRIIYLEEISGELMPGFYEYFEDELLDEGYTLV